MLDALRLGVREVRLVLSAREEVVDSGESFKDRIWVEAITFKRSYLTVFINNVSKIIPAFWCNSIPPVTDTVRIIFCLQFLKARVILSKECFSSRVAFSAIRHRLITIC